MEDSGLYEIYMGGLTIAMIPSTDRNAYRLRFEKGYYRDHTVEIEGVLPDPSKPVRLLLGFSFRYVDDTTNEIQRQTVIFAEEARFQGSVQEDFVASVQLSDWIPIVDDSGPYSVQVFGVDFEHVGGFLNSTGSLTKSIAGWVNSIRSVRAW